MWFKTAQIFNAEEEISKLVDYPNIRMFAVRKMTASEPQNDLMEIYHNWDRWASVNETQYVKDFSAVCLLTARYMADTLGKNKVSHILLALVYRRTRRL